MTLNQIEVFPCHNLCEKLTGFWTKTVKVWFLTSFNLWKCASSPSVKNLLIFNLHATNSYKHTKLELNLFSWPVKPTCSENCKDPFLDWMSNCDSKPRLLFIYLLTYIIEAKWIEFYFYAVVINCIY